MIFGIGKMIQLIQKYHMNQLMGPQYNSFQNDSMKDSVIPVA